MSAEKVRTVLMLEEENRETLRLESTLTGKDMAEIVDSLIETHLSETLELLRQRRQQDAQKAKKPSRP